MEFVDNQINIVGNVNGRAVALPLQFPNPIINNGNIMRLQILNGHTESTCLASQSGSVYEIGRKLKDAIYGAVYAGRLLQRVENTSMYEDAGTLVAIKRISRRRLFELRGKTQEDPMKEIAAMQYVGNHENVMGQIECVMDNDNFYSVMPFVMGGELFDYIDANGKMNEDDARELFVQMINGLGIIIITLYFHYVYI
jgi:serine/threonine protein kinase